MILEIFGVLTALSILMIFIGSLKTVDNPAFKTLGFFFLFLLSFTFINYDLEYKSGSTETFSYMCFSCDGSSVPSLAGNTSLITSITSVYDYTAFTDQTSRTIGIYFAIGSAVGMVLSFLEGINRGRK